jgi:hypothetical protein
MHLHVCLGRYVSRVGWHVQRDERVSACICIHLQVSRAWYATASVGLYHVLGMYEHVTACIEAQLNRYLHLLAYSQLQSQVCIFMCSHVSRAEHVCTCVGVHHIMSVHVLRAFVCICLCKLLVMLLHLLASIKS